MFDTTRLVLEAGLVEALYLTKKLGRNVELSVGRFACAGGDTTLDDRTSRAFAQPSPNRRAGPDAGRGRAVARR
ncbi:hypothetical protein [Corallococcus sp. AB011P]|uniref:hypothetical protein n=1 Tax=Corallococcus sp. AB011P TaxID=2316735 RepID=UPI001F3BCAA0|nr:hypothetical protein [Corallococcus sp. AB011P]